MNSESGRRLSLEELKGRNAPQTMIPQDCPSKEEWQELLHRAGRAGAAHGGPHSPFAGGFQREGTVPHRGAVGDTVAGGGQMCTELKRAGRKKEISILPPGLDTALSVPAWLLLLGTLVGMVALRTIWSGLAAVWSAVRVLIP